MSPAQGLTVEIRARQGGQGGEFISKNPDTITIPPTFLKALRNCTFENDAWETEPGATMTPGLIPGQDHVGTLIQWSPGPGVDRLIVASKSGALYKSDDIGETWHLIYAGMAPDRLVVFVEGGEELAGNPRKLFAFGAGPPIVVVGDGNGGDGFPDSGVPAAAAVGPASGGIEVGEYVYVWTALIGAGETLQSPGAFVNVELPGGGEVYLTVPTYPGARARRLYRGLLSEVLADFMAWHLVTEFAGEGPDNYHDTLPNSALLQTGLPVFNSTASVHKLGRPPLDWITGNWPTSAVMAEGRLLAFGIGGQANHLIYVSSGDDHEDFLTIPRVIQCYPGEGSGLVGACFWRGRAWFWKQPRGVYSIDTAPLDLDFWTPRRHSGAVGLAGPLAWTQIKAPEGGQFFDDIVFVHTDGSWHRVSKLEANQDGDVNVSSISETTYAPFIRANVDLRHIWYTQMAYYEDIEEIQGAFRRINSPTEDPYNNFRIKANFQRMQDYGIRFHHSDFPTCESIAMVTLSNRQRKPMAGGYDVVRLLNDTSSYTIDRVWPYSSEFWTHDDNFQDLAPDQKLAYKLFHFITLEYQSTGAWDLVLEVYIDGLLAKILTIPMARTGTGFILDQSQLGTPLGGSLGGGLATYTRRLYGRGRRIAFRGQLAGLGQWFRIVNMTLGWSPGGIPGGNKL